MKNSVMRMGNITVVGLKAISRNKLRSFLTMLGIVIGVGCVIAVVAIGNGATKSVEATINSLGTNYIMIFPGASTQSGARIFTGNSTMPFLTIVSSTNTGFTFEFEDLNSGAVLSLASAPASLNIDYITLLQNQ